MGWRNLAGGAQIDPRDDSRVPHPFVFGSFLPAAGTKGWVLLRFGFSLANLSLGLARHQPAALHPPLHLVNRPIHVRHWLPSYGTPVANIAAHDPPRLCVF